MQVVTAWDQVGAAVAVRQTAVCCLLPQLSFLGEKVAVYWDPDDGHLRLTGDFDACRIAARRLAVHQPEIADSAHPDEFVRVKAAAPLGVINSVWSGANKAIGGPNALTNSIVGGLATGALGYGAGALLEQAFPEQYVQRGKLRRTLALLGSSLGTLPGIWKGTANARNDATSFLRGMTTADAAPGNPQLQKLGQQLQDMPLNEEFRTAVDLCSFEFEKFAYGGSLDVPSVPVDAFNRAIWNDVRMGVAASENPFGTKSQWGDDSQSLHTPAPVGAAAIGLMQGIAAQHGGIEVLRPRDVIAGLASAGVGLAVANMAGRTLSALAGLTPEAQSQLQQAGLWGGILRHVVPPLFGYR